MSNVTVNLSYDDDDLNELYLYDSETSIYDQQNPLYFLISLTVASVCIFIVGLIGNVVTCIVIVCNKSMHTTTNYYLFNLAISDLLLLIAGVPYEIYDIWNPYNYLPGRIGCFWLFWIMEVVVLVSNMTVTAFTVERYLAICRPFVAQIISQISRTTKLIAGIWFIAFLFAFGGVWKNEFIVFGDKSMCTFNHNAIPYYMETLMIIFYFIPMTIIVILYVLIGIRVVKSSRMQKGRGDAKQDSNKIDGSTKKVFKMLVAVVVAFFICWTPFHVQRVYTANSPVYIDEADLKKYKMLDDVLYYISGILYYSSAAINPIIYNTMSNKFRSAFKEVLSKFCKMYRPINLSFSSANINNNNVLEIPDTPL